MTGGADPNDDAKLSALERGRRFAKRVRSLPASAETTRSALEEVVAERARFEALLSVIHTDPAVPETLKSLIEQLSAKVRMLERSTATQAELVRRSISNSSREAETQNIIAGLAEASEPKPGLSICICSWNHGSDLPNAAASALSILDLLEEEDRGELIVIDDASDDDTPLITAELAKSDSRVQVIRPRHNVGLTHARNIALHLCPTRYLFTLDADNVAIPAGVLQLYRSALQTGAAFTYGSMTRERHDGQPLGMASNEPPSEPLATANYIDASGLVDVSQRLALGGWDASPEVERAEDWWTLLRMLTSGQLVVFVPTIIAHYRVHETSMFHSVADMTPYTRLVERTFNQDGALERRLRGDGFAFATHHPDIGTLLATSAAKELLPKTSAAAEVWPAHSAVNPAASHPEVGRPRLLLIGTGGVSNLGDDAIVIQALWRARREFGEEWAIDVICDGIMADFGDRRTRQLSTLISAVAGLPREAFEAEVEDLSRPDLIGTSQWTPLRPSDYQAAVFVGGGHSDQWRRGLLDPRALLASALRQAEVPFAWSGQSFQVRDEHLDVLEMMLRGAKSVSVRDSLSAGRVAATGLMPGLVTELNGDDGLGLEARTNGTLDRMIADGPYLLVSVRSTDYVNAPIKDWAMACDQYAAANGLNVLGIALNSQPPEPELATLSRLRATLDFKSRWYICDVSSDPRLLAGAASSATAIAALSYHVVLFGLSAGRPSVLGAFNDYYRAKADGLQQLTQLDVPLGVTKVDSLAETLDDVKLGLQNNPRPLSKAVEDVDDWWRRFASDLSSRRRP